MKLKYYLRGLGIGIVVTAFVMGLISSKSKMSDAEIMERARTLGMTESSVLSELQQTEITEESSTSSSEEAKEQSKEAEPSETELSEVETTEAETIEVEPTESVIASEEESAKETTPQSEVTVQPEKGGTTSLESNNSDSIQIVIKSGESSDTVSRKLFDAGLVSSATEYDKYLCANGYANKITAGTHTIPTDATEEEIASLLCNR